MWPMSVIRNGFLGAGITHWAKQAAHMLRGCCRDLISNLPQDYLLHVFPLLSHPAFPSSLRCPVSVRAKKPPQKEIYFSLVGVCLVS